MKMGASWNAGSAKQHQQTHECDRTVHFGRESTPWDAVEVHQITTGLALTDGPRVLSRELIAMVAYFGAVRVAGAAGLAVGAFTPPAYLLPSS